MAVAEHPGEAVGGAAGACLQHARPAVLAFVLTRL